MAGWTVTVPIGPSSTQLGGPLISGAVIYNNDPTNTVWVGSQNVKPGAGTPIKPLSYIPVLTPSGTAGVTTPKQFWAVVDSGVSTPIILTVTEDASAYNDTIAEGAAIALAIAEEGIPSVFLRTLIYSATSITPATGTGLHPITTYATVEVHLTPSTVANCSCVVQQFDENSIVIAQDDVSLYDTMDTSPIVLRIPVVGVFVGVVNGGAGAVTVSMYGTNRSVERTRNNGNSGARQFTVGPVALAGGQRVLMTSTASGDDATDVYISDFDIGFSLFSSNNVSALDQIQPFFRAILSVIGSVDYYTPYLLSTGGPNIAAGYASTTVPQGTVAVGIWNTTVNALPSTTYTLSLGPSRTA